LCREECANDKSNKKALTKECDVSRARTFQPPVRHPVVESNVSRHLLIAHFRIAAKECGFAFVLVVVGALNQGEPAILDAFLAFKLWQEQKKRHVVENDTVLGY
jgi:hypothetical protein